MAGVVGCACVELCPRRVWVSRLWVAMYAVGIVLAMVWEGQLG